MLKESAILPETAKTIPAIPYRLIFSLKKIKPKIAKKIGTVSTSVVEIDTETYARDKNHVAKWMARNIPEKTIQCIRLRVERLTIHETSFFAVESTSAPIPAKSVRYIAEISGAISYSCSLTTIIAAQETARIAIKSKK